MKTKQLQSFILLGFINSEKYLIISIAQFVIFNVLILHVVFNLYITTTIDFFPYFPPYNNDILKLALEENNFTPCVVAKMV